MGCVRVGYGDGLGWNGVRWNGIGVKWGWVEMGWCGIGMGRVRVKIGLSEVVWGSGGLGWAEWCPYAPYSEENLRSRCSSTCAPGAAGGYSYLITKLSATIGKLSANPAPWLAVVLVRLCVCSSSRPLFLRLFARSLRLSLAPVCPPVGASTAAQMDIHENDDDMFAERAAQEAQEKAKAREREAQAIYNEQERYNSMPTNQFQCVAASPCPCPCHLPPAYSSPLAPRSSLLTPQSTRVSVCRRGCPLRMKDLVKRTHGRENGKVVGLPTITDSLGFSDQKKEQ